MGTPWRTRGIASASWLLVVSPLVCIVGGSLIGTALFGAADMVSGGSPGAVLRAYPAMLLFSLMVTVPFGAIAGLVAGGIAIRLGSERLRGAGRRRWIRTGLMYGGGVGLGCPLVVVAMGFGGGSLLKWLVAYGTVGGLTGLALGAAVGVIGWREYGDRATRMVAEDRE